MNFKDTKRKIRCLLAEVAGDLSATDINNVLELLEHHELGIAFELICTQLHEHGKSVTPEQRIHIAQIAERMQLGDNSWNYLNVKNDDD